MKHRMYLGVAVFILTMVSMPVFAHDQEFDISFLYPLEEKDYEHVDADPWKGTVTFNVTNNGTIPWTDFHFEIISIDGFNPATSVEIYDSLSIMPPSSDRSPVSIIVGETGNGHDKIDYYFAGDPVGYGETAQFVFYTDNTVNTTAIFGILAYPTPEPSLMVLLGTGGLMMLRRRRKTA